jgi:FAD:protein FMN transferase
MGTTVTVVVPDVDRAAAVLVEGLFARWEATLSRFRPESELSRLNAAGGRPFRASALLLAVVEEALQAARATDGAFDPALEQAMRAVGYDRTFDAIDRDGPPLGPAAPGGAWREIEVDHAARTIRLPAGATLDLGGIAKGMAVDAAIGALFERGVRAGIVEAGGDLAAVGLPRGLPAWTVGVEARNGVREVAITSGALATSGISRRAWRRGGVEQHHLLDARTGLPAANDLWSVTAAAVTCAQAEVAAKVAFVLGRDAGARFLLGVGVSALLVRRDGGELLVGPWAGASADAPSAPHTVISLSPRGLP